MPRIQSCLSILGGAQRFTKGLGFPEAPQRGSVELHDEEGGSFLGLTAMAASRCAPEVEPVASPLVASCPQPRGDLISSLAAVGAEPHSASWPWGGGPRPFTMLLSFAVSMSHFINVRKFYDISRVLSLLVTHLSAKPSLRFF